MVEKAKKCGSKDIMDELFARYPALDSCRDDILKAFHMILDCYKNGGKVLLAGNGGSAADCDHFTGEMTKSFRFKRSVGAEMESKMEEYFGDAGKELCSHLEGGLPTIPLTQLTASNTAFGNDVDPQASFAQLVNAIGKKGDIFIGITTSGNSGNILKALMVSKVKEISTIVLTGRTGGKSKALCDICVCAPEDETFKIQEYHLPIYHALCASVEAELF